MFDLGNVLKKEAPRELFDFVSACKSGDDLVKKLESDPSRLFAFIQNMKVDGNEPLAARLLYKVNSDYLDNAQVKKVETTFRNLGMLNRTNESTISLHVEGSAEPVQAHKSILALASRYFKGMLGFKDFQDDKLLMKDEEISPEVYKLAVDYLYLSDKDRKDFISTVNESLLLEMAKLSFHWQIDELNNLCDDELCNSIGEFNIEKSDIDDWLAESDFVPKFVKLLKFVNRVAGDGDLAPVIDQMQTPAGAAKYAAMCEPEEIELFATLKTELGKACQIPPGTFGKAEWEKTFPVTIKEVSPLPPNIHAILEQEDPWEPSKKLKETCQFFLRPEKVILHDPESGDRELTLGFDEVEELAKMATDESRRSEYSSSSTYLSNIKVETSRWVLMRKKVIPTSKNKSFYDQKKLLEGSFEVPKTIDAILLNFITYASSGENLYGIYISTRCQEKDNIGRQIVVGGFSGDRINVGSFGRKSEKVGLSGSWKF